MSRSSLAWLILLGAGLLECGWAIGLKYTNGFSRLVPSVLTVVAMAGSFAGLTYALKTLPTGSAYAVWTGIGAAATAALGIVLFDEPATLVRLAGIAFVIIGIAAIRLSG